MATSPCHRTSNLSVEDFAWLAEKPVADLALAAAAPSAASRPPPQRPAPPSPSRLASHPGGNGRTARSADVTASRRLDLLEAKVLSNWHEFLVHRQEVQLKLEELFESWRTGSGHKPRGQAIVHVAGLGRRVESCEQGLQETTESSQGIRRQLADLRSLVGDNRDTIEDLRKLVAGASREAAEAFKTAADLQAELHGQASGLKSVVQTLTGRIHSETRDALQKSDHELREAVVGARTQAEKQLQGCMDEVAEMLASQKAETERQLKRHCSESAVASELSSANFERRLLELRSESAASTRKLEAALEAGVDDLENKLRTQMRDILEAGVDALENKLHTQMRDMMKAAESADSLSEKRFRRISAEQSQALDAAEEQFEWKVRRSRDEAAEDARGFEALLDRRVRWSREEASQVGRDLEVWAEQRMRRSHAELADAGQGAVAKVGEAGAEIAHLRAQLAHEEQHLSRRAEAFSESCLRRAYAETAETIGVAEAAMELRWRRSVTEASDVIEARLSKAISSADSTCERVALEGAERVAHLSSSVGDLKEDLRRLRRHGESQEVLRHAAVERTARSRSPDANRISTGEVGELRQDLIRLKREIARQSDEQARSLRKEFDEQMKQVKHVSRIDDVLDIPSKPGAGALRADSGSEPWSAVSDTASTVARRAAARVDELSAQLVRMRREAREEVTRAEQTAKRAAREEVERRLTDAEWVVEQRHEKLARSVEQQRLSEGSFRAEFSREVTELRNMVNDLRGRGIGASLPRDELPGFKSLSMVSSGMPASVTASPRFGANQ